MVFSVDETPDATATLPFASDTKALLAFKLLVAMVVAPPVIVACLPAKAVFTSAFVYGALVPLHTPLAAIPVLKVTLLSENETKFEVLAEFLTLITYHAGISK